MQETFVKLIQIAIGKRSQLDTTPTADEWQALFDEAQRQTLAGVLYPAVEILPKHQRPPRHIFLSWFSLKEAIVDHNKKMDHNCVWVAERFKKVGFRNVILKGQGNALLYPTPGLRQAGDIDIWLEGKRKDIIEYVRRFFPKQRVQWIEVEFPIKKDTVIEVHTTPGFMSCPTDNRRLQRYFKERQQEMIENKVALDKGEISIPTLEVNLVFQLTHIYRHLFNEGIGLRQLMDYYYLLQNEGAKALLPQIRKETKRLHMTRFCRALMWVLGEVFLLERELMVMEPDEQEGRFLLREIMLAGNFGLLDERNIHKASKWGNFWQITNRNWRFVTHYPREVIWNPIYRLWQFGWRIKNGYK